MTATGGVVVAYLYPEKVSGDFMDHFLQMVAYNFGGPKRLHGYLSVQSGPNLSAKRNEAVRRFLDEFDDDTEWLLFLDSDMVFPADILERLLADADPEKAPIVGGLCFGSLREKGLPQRYFPTMYYVNEKGESWRLKDYPRDQFVPVDATGAACLLIHRSVFAPIAEKWGEPFPWFEEARNHAGGFYSEDTMFCIRAKLAGFPVHVDTRVKVGHVKPQLIDETTFEEWQEAQTEPQFVITGTGRSGTGYIASLFNAVSIKCGHENWFNPWEIRDTFLKGEASWLAVPHLEEYGGKVGLQVRNPLKVMRSLLNGDLFGTDGSPAPWARPYYDAKAEHIEFTGDPMTDAATYIVRWAEWAEAYADKTWRLEDIDAELFAEIAAWAGYEIPVSMAEQAVNLISNDTNRHRRAQLRWKDIPEGGIFDELREHARKYGYLE